MFETRVKSISTIFALTLMLGAGPIACSSAPPAASDVSRPISFQKTDGDYTISTADRSYLANLDGIKLLNKAGPKADSGTDFDVALEVQGVGLQFESERTYGYMRVDRTFTNDHSVGIRFRFQF